jgi:branched-chain amino acid transport system substrate-binding protein
MRAPRQTDARANSYSYAKKSLRHFNHRISSGKPKDCRSAQEMNELMRYRRTHIVVVSALVALVATVASACGTSSGATPSGSGDKTIIIGANTEETGAAAAIGSEYAKGIQLAVSLLNQDGGIAVKGTKYTVKLIQLDNKSDPQTALANMQKLVDDGAKIIIGPSTNATSAPIYQKYANGSLLMVSYGITIQQFQGKSGGQYLFEAQPSSQTSITKMVQVVQNQYHPKTAALLLPQDSSGEAHQEYITAELAKLGVKVVYNTLFPDSTTDFAPYITAMKQDNPDIVFTGYLDSWVGPILSAAKQAGFTSPAFVGTNGTSVAPFQENPSLHGAVNVPTRSVINTNDPQVAGYRTAWKNEFGSYPTDPNTFWSLAYYDTILMLAKAMEIAGTTTDLAAITNALTSSAATNYPHRVLDLSYDAEHNAVAPTQVAIIGTNAQISYVNVAS